MVWVFRCLIMMVKAICNICKKTCRQRNKSEKRSHPSNPQIPATPINTRASQPTKTPPTRIHLTNPNTFTLSPNVPSASNSLPFPDSEVKKEGARVEVETEDSWNLVGNAGKEKKKQWRKRKEEQAKKQVEMAKREEKRVELEEVGVNANRGRRVRDNQYKPERTTGKFSDKKKVKPERFTQSEKKKVEPEKIRGKNSEKINMKKEKGRTAQEAKDEAVLKRAQQIYWAEDRKQNFEEERKRRELLWKVKEERRMEIEKRKMVVAERRKREEERRFKELEAKKQVLNPGEYFTKVFWNRNLKTQQY